MTKTRRCVPRPTAAAGEASDVPAASRLGPFGLPVVRRRDAETGYAYPPRMTDFVWRGQFQNDEVRRLHAEAFSSPAGAHDWWARVNAHSLGWVCARDDRELVGFVNVAWDGALHAFILDPMVATTARRRRLGTALVTTAAEEARSKGCHWLHVDFEDHLRGFYFGACGFQPTNAGLINLVTPPGGTQE